jgi:hypothetical protein
MSGIPQFLNNLLWGKNEDYYRLPLQKSAPCFSFFSMQIVRFVMILVLIGVWGINFYVNVKKCFMYLNFWALTFTLLYMLCIIPASGRQVIEEQLDQQAKKGKKEGEVAGLDLSERSRSWKRAVFFHSTAWPFVATSVALFSAFFMDDQLCSTQLDFGFALWRRNVVFIATYFPIFVLSVDLMFNCLVFSHKHIITTFIIFLAYLGGAWVGSKIQDRPIYAGHFAFQPCYGNDYDYSTSRHNYT